ncbi:MAG TPA: carboxypeptidase-like regulatory domain-containing protein [Gemmatimonadaceae bacterium]|nr:carboxypeptidase-like regulatory domain-containing protein [Gemmatimonadaceae bacterium]
MRLIDRHRLLVTGRRLGGAVALSIAAAQLSAQGTATAPALPAYRYRLLGVYDPASGEPVEGAEVMDLLTKTSALTTKTGTVALIFVPDGGGVIRIRKVGYQPVTMTIGISPDDTVPVTVMLSTTATTLPAVVTTTDSAHHYSSPRLREFEDRLKQGFGQFITEADLRKNDNGKMSNVVRRFTGMRIDCRGSTCRANSSRQAMLRGGVCPVALYIDGVPATDSNLENINVNEYAAVEFYPGGATVPPLYNKTNRSCGVMLLWSRER